MDKKSKILIWVFVILILGSVGVTYWRIMVQKDYVVEAQIDCDPYAEECFVWECDPESDEEGEACTGDPEADIWYFKVARRNAANIPLCDPETDETCDPWTCGEGEKDCEEEFCTEENMEDQYASSCIDPAVFTEENPIEEEEEESAEGEETADGEGVAEEEESEAGSTCEVGNTECLQSEDPAGTAIEAEADTETEAGTEIETEE